MSQKQLAEKALALKRANAAKQANAAPDDDDLVPANIAAQRLGVTQAVLGTWRWRGQGPPFYKIGNQIRYRLRDIVEYRESCRRRSTSQEAPA
jgi:hypothetical protein